MKLPSHRSAAGRRCGVCSGGPAHGLQRRDGLEVLASGWWPPCRPARRTTLRTGGVTSGGERFKGLVGGPGSAAGSDIMLATRRGFHGRKGGGAVTGTEQDRERRRVQLISFPGEECLNLERRGQTLDLSPYEAELAP